MRSHRADVGTNRGAYADVAAVLNAADEVAVEAFLNRRIPFSDIPNLIAATLEAHQLNRADRLEAVIEADAWARRHALRWLP